LTLVLGPVILCRRAFGDEARAGDLRGLALTPGGFLMEGFARSGRGGLESLSRQAVRV
jgi:hypothetical protein